MKTRKRKTKGGMYNGFFIRSPLSFLEKKKKCIKNNVTRFLTRSKCVDDYINIATANSRSFLNDNEELITKLKNTRGLFGKRKRIRLLKELTDEIDNYNSRVNPVNQQETTHKNGSNDNDYEIDYEMFKINEDHDEQDPSDVEQDPSDVEQDPSDVEQDPSDVVQPNEVEVSDQPLTFEERVNLWKFNQPILWGQPPITPAYRSFLDNYNFEDYVEKYKTDVEKYEKNRLDKEFEHEYNAWIQTENYENFKKGFMEGSLLNNYNNLENYAIKHFLTEEKQEREEQERQRKKQERKKQKREKQEQEKRKREEQEREKQEQERKKREREKREQEKQEQEKREREEQKLKEQDSRALEQERIKRMDALTEINEEYESSFDELHKKIDTIKNGNDVDYIECLQYERKILMDKISELKEVNEYTFYATEKTLKYLTLKCEKTKMEKILVEMNQYEAIRKQIEEIQGYLDERIGTRDDSYASVKEAQLKIFDKFDGLLERMKNNKNNVADNLMRINDEIDILKNASVDLDNALSSDFEKDTIFRFLQQKRELAQDKSKIRRENKGGRRTRKQKSKRFSRIKRKVQKHKSKNINMVTIRKRIQKKK